MKRLLLILPMLTVAMFACNVYVEEPVPVIVHDDRDHVTGYYHVEEYNVTTGGYAEYDVSVAKSAHDLFTIYIDNFYGVGISVVAEVEGLNVYIPEQQVDGYHIAGDGYVDGNVLVLDYSVHDHLDAHSHVMYYEFNGYR
ncbi:MAG: hypothetical protein R3345_09235 [Fulvivirga sp.]|nr:hypothetical protein [Fulvivirga sp.]